LACVNGIGFRIFFGRYLDETLPCLNSGGRTGWENHDRSCVDEIEEREESEEVGLGPLVDLLEANACASACAIAFKFWGPLGRVLNRGGGLVMRTQSNVRVFERFWDRGVARGGRERGGDIISTPSKVRGFCNLFITSCVEVEDDGADAGFRAGLTDRKFITSEEVEFSGTPVSCFGGLESTAGFGMTTPSNVNDCARFNGVGIGSKSLTFILTITRLLYWRRQARERIKLP
jgi:hypothetical protein